MKACEAVVSNNGLNASSVCRYKLPLVQLSPMSSCCMLPHYDMMHYKFSFWNKPTLGCCRSPIVFFHINPQLPHHLLMCIPELQFTQQNSKKKMYHALLMRPSSPYSMQACWDDNFNGRHLFQQTDFLHSPLLDELKALETRVLAEFAVNLPSALVVDRYAQTLNVDR